MFRQGGRVGDAPQQAAPFDKDAVNITFFGDFLNPTLLEGGIMMDVGHHFVGAKAVFRRGSTIQIAKHGMGAIGLPAYPGQSSFLTVLIAMKPKASAQISNVIH